MTSNSPAFILRSASPQSMALISVPDAGLPLPELPLVDQDALKFAIVCQKDIGRIVVVHEES